MIGKKPENKEVKALVLSGNVAKNQDIFTGKPLLHHSNKFQMLSLLKI